MSTFWSLLKESVIVQATLTLGIWAAIIYMVVTKQIVPDVLTNSGYAVLGFYFGSKLALSQANQYRGSNE